MFTTLKILRLPDTDATGALYFTWQLRVAQEIFEEFLETRGFPLINILRDYPFLFPVVHAEADFLSPLRLGDTARVELSIPQIGSTSLSYEVRFFRGSSPDLAGTARLVHVCIDRLSGEKREVPGFLRACLAV